MSSTRMPSNATLEEAEELTKRLSEALSTGNEEESVILTRKLCRLSLPVCVSIERLVYPKDQIRLAVGVETAQSETPMPLTVVVSCGMTISQLKDEINKEYGFPHALQHWVIGKCLARDEETLFYYGVRRHGDQAFLFIRSPEDQSPVERQESGENRPPVERQESGENRLEDSQESFTVIPEENESKELYCSKVLPTPPLLPPPPPPPPLHTLPRRQSGWVCLKCTFDNAPTRPGCEVCGNERPESYRVPLAYNPLGEEAVRIRREEASTLLLMKFLQTDTQEDCQTTESSTLPPMIQISPWSLFYNLSQHPEKNHEN
ncbi:ranBP-type and C3HC4-type zinc finger-containing protein 1-like isoform X3 [Stigmatopora argus]